MSILSIENLSYTYPGGQKAVLREVNADFEPGKMYAITGPSGSGHFRQMVSAGDALSFGDVRDDDLRGVTRVHRQERVLHACLVLYIVERVGHLTDIMVKRTRSNKQRIRADSLRGFRGEVRHLHRVLEGTRRTLGEGVQ